MSSYPFLNPTYLQRDQANTVECSLDARRKVSIHFNRQLKYVNLCPGHKADGTNESFLDVVYSRQPHFYRSTIVVYGSIIYSSQPCMCGAELNVFTGYVPHVTVVVVIRSVDVSL